MSRYLFSNSHAVAMARLTGLEAIEDPSTIECLGQLGTKPGWHCLEIGAGAGSVARWLAGRVGATGRVVATDIDTALLDSSSYEVWRHDIVRDQLPEAAFDLVHLRHVMFHIDQSQVPAVLRSLVGALKLGGVLLAEESDLHSWRPTPVTPEPLRNAFVEGVQATLEIYRSRGQDTALGRRLGALIESAGLRPVRIERRIRTVGGCSAEARFHQQSASQLADAVGAANPAASDVLRRLENCFADRDLQYETRTTVSVTAMKPPAQ
jgi:predicted O-methyltransferase YrrM